MMPSFGQVLATVAI